jgi:hypothetical protein
MFPSEKLSLLRSLMRLVFCGSEWCEPHLHRPYDFNVAFFSSYLALACSNGRTLNFNISPPFF